MYEAQQQYQQYAQPIQQGYRVIPVSDIAEANATQVDLSGNPIFFYNKGLNEIYIKQFNQVTGLADFKMFKLADLPTDKPDEKEEMLNIINEKLDTLLQKKGVKNDKSTTD